MLYTSDKNIILENLSSLIANLFFVNIKPILDIALFLNILCIVQYNLYFVNARALKNPSRNVSAKTLTTNFAIDVKFGRTLVSSVLQSHDTVTCPMFTQDNDDKTLNTECSCLAEISL